MTLPQQITLARQLAALYRQIGDEHERERHPDPAAAIVQRNRRLRRVEESARRLLKEQLAREVFHKFCSA